MKKLLLILFCLPMIGFGQGFERSLEVGLTLGPSVNSSDHPLMELFQSMERVGNKHITFTEGISLRYNYSSFISFSTQVGYKNIRNEYSDDFLYDYISITLIGDWKTVSTQKHIHIPFLLEYNLSQERLKLSLKAGVYTSYLLDNIMTTTQGKRGGIQVEYICECYNEWDFGATGGIGLSYAINNKYSLIFDFLVNQSLLKTPSSSLIVTETSIKEEIEGGKYYNNASYTALLGFSYTLKQ